jgi:hypothetical protein
LVELEEVLLVLMDLPHPLEVTRLDREVLKLLAVLLIREQL